MVLDALIRSLARVEHAPRLALPEAGTGTCLVLSESASPPQPASPWPKYPLRAMTAAALDARCLHSIRCAPGTPTAPPCAAGCRADWPTGYARDGCAGDAPASARRCNEAARRCNAASLATPRPLRGADRAAPGGPETRDAAQAAA